MVLREEGVVVLAGYSKPQSNDFHYAQKGRQLITRRNACRPEIP